MVSTIEMFYCIKESQLGPKGVLHRVVSLYSFPESTQTTQTVSLVPETTTNHTSPQHTTTMKLGKYMTDDDQLEVEQCPTAKV